MNIVPSREREREWYLPKGGLFVADVMSCARARSMRARSPRGPGCSATGAMTSTGGCAMTGTGPTRPHMDTGSWSGRTGIGDQQQEIINSSWNIFSLLLRAGMRETGWTGADRGRVCMSASSRAPNMRWRTLQQWHRDFSWSYWHHQGQYNNDKKEGQGKYSWSNGDWYEGEWKAGLRHGHGIYVWKDKNEKYDSWHSISIGRQPIYSSKISFFRRLYHSLHHCIAFFQFQKNSSFRTTHSTFHQKFI